MKNKVLAMIRIIVTVGVIVPANLIGYATSDVSYAESVDSEMSIADLSLEVVDNEGSSESIIDENVQVDIADVLGMDVQEEMQYSLVLGEELVKYNIVYVSKADEQELEQKFKDLHEIESMEKLELDESSIIDITNSTREVDLEAIQKEREENGESGNDEKAGNDEAVLAQADVKMATEPAQKPIITNVDQSGTLLQAAVVDEGYTGVAVQLTESDRDLLERLVMGEAGAEGYEGAALVAQALRDTMVYKGFNSIEEIRVNLKYSGSINKEPNQDVKNAVAYIFDEGGMAVKHTIFYFYAPKLVKSSFHESQLFIVEYKGHRFFSNR